MIAIIQDQFEHNIANTITGFLEHPTAPMIKEFKRYTDLLTFDKHNDWRKGQSVSHLTKLAGTKRAYVTYNKGGQQGGVARLSNRNTDLESSSTAWYVWNLGRNPYIYICSKDSIGIRIGREERGRLPGNQASHGKHLRVARRRALLGRRRRHGLAGRGGTGI